MARKGKNGGSVLQGQALKDFRHNVSKLKAAGVVSKRVDARSQKATKYMRAKVRKFQDVLEGRQIAVKAKPDVRAKYADILETRGSFIMVPRERAKEKAKISRGLVEIERTMLGPDKLPFGTEREVILPFKLTDMPALVDRLQTDETLDGLKQPDEMFAFKIDGWSSKIGFPDAKEMGDYISVNYAHLFKPGMAKKVVKYLTFVRYRNYGSSRAAEGDHTGRFPNKPGSKHRRTKWDVQRSQKRDATRKAIARANETPADRKERLEKQRIRSAQNRQRKFEDK